MLPPKLLSSGVASSSPLIINESSSGCWSSTGSTAPPPPPPPPPPLPVPSIISTSAAPLCLPVGARSGARTCQEDSAKRDVISRNNVSTSGVVRLRSAPHLGSVKEPSTPPVLLLRWQPHHPPPTNPTFVSPARGVKLNFFHTTTTQPLASKRGAAQSRCEGRSARSLPGLPLDSMYFKVIACLQGGGAGLRGPWGSLRGSWVNLKRQ